MQMNDISKMTKDEKEKLLLISVLKSCKGVLDLYDDRYLYFRGEISFKAEDYKEFDNGYDENQNYDPNVKEVISSFYVSAPLYQWYSNDLDIFAPTISINRHPHKGSSGYCMKYMTSIRNTTQKNPLLRKVMGLLSSFRTYTPNDCLRPLPFPKYRKLRANTNPCDYHYHCTICSACGKGNPSSDEELVILKYCNYCGNMYCKDCAPKITIDINGLLKEFDMRSIFSEERCYSCIRNNISEIISRYKDEKKVGVEKLLEILYFPYVERVINSIDRNNWFYKIQKISGYFRSMIHYKRKARVEENSDEEEWLRILIKNCKNDIEKYKRKYQPNPTRRFQNEVLRY